MTASGARPDKADCDYSGRPATLKPPNWFKIANILEKCPALGLFDMKTVRP
jgi:hypothetical protein